MRRDESHEEEGGLGIRKRTEDNIEKSKIQGQKLERMQKEIELLRDRVQVILKEFQTSQIFINEVQQSINKLQQSHDNLRSELHTYLSFASLGLDTRNIPLRRYIPVRIYFSESKEAPLATETLNAILHILDLSVSDDFPPEIGSFWKQLFAKTNKVATQPEVAERLQKAERIIELQGLHQPQSQVDKNEAEAASTVITSLDKVSSAAIQVGSLVIVKSSDLDGKPCIQARTLSQQEMIFLEKNQHLLKAPQEIFDNLAAFNREELVERNAKIDTLTTLVKPEYRSADVTGKIVGEFLDKT